MDIVYKNAASSQITGAEEIFRMKNHILSRYLAGQFLIRTFSITLALAGILSVFDLLGNIISVTAHHDNTIVTVLQYLSLRSPQIFILSLPLGVLLASMVTFFRLIHSQEVAAIFAAGVAVSDIALILSKAVLVFVFIHLLLSNTIVPNTTFRLQVWAKNDYRGEPPATGRPLLPSWFKISSDMIYAEKANFDGHVLENIVLIRRDKLGIMEQYYKADKAYYKNDGWLLNNVTKTDIQKKDTVLENQVFVPLTLKPEDILLAGRSDSSMNLLDLYRISSDPRLGRQVNSLYKVWFQRNLAASFESLIMVLLATPLVFQQARQNSMSLHCFMIIAAGFGYFIVERLLLSLGETSILPVMLAVWGPFVIFGMIGWWVLLYKQE